MRRLLITVLAMAMLAIALAGNASAATLKVCPDADKCFTSIQAAIDAAAGVPVEQGRFGARMEVELVNDGPVTIVLE
jgi:D-tyrosyl-tRNA(Tyr) deacylase